jgi:hypothetical protein
MHLLPIDINIYYSRYCKYTHRERERIYKGGVKKVATISARRPFSEKEEKKKLAAFPPLDGSFFFWPVRNTTVFQLDIQLLLLLLLQHPIRRSLPTKEEEEESF